MTAVSSKRAQAKSLGRNVYVKSLVLMEIHQQLFVI